MNSRNSDASWRALGEADPYFAVLTSDDYRSDTIADRKADFFSKGEVAIEETLRTAVAHFPTMRFGRALDFGCGVGRLTLPLARRFAEVVGVDIAPAMLREAKANAGDASLANAQFVISDDQLTQVEGQFDFINSCIVLQHIPVRLGMVYIDQLLARLSDGGIANIHFTVDRQQGLLRRLLNWAQIHLPLVNRATNLVRGKRAGEPLMQMNEYPFAKVVELFHTHGILAPTVLFSPQGSTLAVYLLGQKRTPTADDEIRA